MIKPMFLRHFLKAVIILMSSVLLGCTSSAINYLPLENADNSVDLDIEWRRVIGSGNQGEYLQLTPLVVGDQVYVADPSGRVEALDLKNGKQRWSTTLDLAVSAGISGDQDQLFIATDNGQVHALSPSDGDVLWSANLTSETLAAVAFDQRRLFVHTVDGRITALERVDGKQAWSYQSTLPVLTVRGVSQPLLVGPLVVVGLATGKVIGLDKVLGVPRWNARLGVPDGRSELERLVDIDGSVVLADNKLFASAYNGNLVAMEPSGKVLWEEAGSAYSKPAVGLGSLYLTLDDGSIQSFDSLNGAKSWRQAALQGRGIGPVASFGSLLLTVDQTGYLHAINQVDGALAGRTLVRPKPLHRTFPHQGEATNWRAMRDVDFAADSPIVATDAGALLFTNSGELMLVDIQVND